MALGTERSEKKVKNKACNESLELARRIRAADIRIHIEEDDCKSTDVPSAGVLLYLFGGETESTAVDFFGRTAFIIYANITINLPRFAISAFGLELPWNCAVHWLEDPLERDDSSKVYRFGGRDLLDFKRGRVLNHRADVCRTLSRGSSLRGCLLGVGDKPMPDHFSHGMMVPCFLSVFDQFGREYREPISLCADRSQKLLRRTRSQAPRKRIFDYPDSGYGHPLLQDDDVEVNK
jgi:hypothetical protein